MKPPWEEAVKQWQKRPSGVTTHLEAIGFGAWKEGNHSELRAAKEKISPLEETKRWELIKKMVNPYELVFTHEDPHFHPSISVLKPLSRSYFKLIEMLDVLQFFTLLPKQLQKIRTAHVAEGPGGFIQAIIHLAERYHKSVQQATAMTLRPTDQYVPGWKRASSFLHHHREVKLHYGADGTGNVYVLENQDSFVRNTSPGAHIFTADGGFDFSIDYNEQERRAFHLIVCSATVGLRSLAENGCFVLKIFDIFSESTKILMLIISRCFKEWMFYKPALSRPCNSERYFLGRGFKGLYPGCLNMLHMIQRECLRESYPIHIESFATKEELDYLEEHSHSRTEQQLMALKRAEFYTKYPGEWYKNQLQIDFQTSLRWCYKFRIPTHMTQPLKVCDPILTSSEASCQCISERDVVQQSLLPGDDLSALVPSSQAS